MALRRDAQRKALIERIKRDPAAYAADRISSMTTEDIDQLLKSLARTQGIDADGR